MRHIGADQVVVTADEFDREPTAAELDAIEQELPLIVAEVDLLDAQIMTLDRIPSELDARRLRRARNRALAARRVLANRAAGVMLPGGCGVSTLTAQMSSDGGPWRLYVVLFGAPDWPTFRWERSVPVPTVAERRGVLDMLGYEVAPGAEWSWTEDSRDPGDDSTPTILIAAVGVRPRGAVTA
jgi:hypothetical protein